MNLPTAQEDTKLSALLPMLFYKLAQQQKMCERRHQLGVMTDLKSLKGSFHFFLW